MTLAADHDFVEEALACARYGETEELKELLDTRPNVLVHGLRNASGNTPLHMASANGHLEAVDFLCQRCTTVDAVNAQNGEGNTPLHWAALNGHKDVVGRLLEAGADVAVSN
ncbi:ankyrin repeat-containing domain protein [Thamnocephalis sphaerospora]|uniref:Ankyrin repeat-containing domain protein n=1 Tax=Thamnocephalis sphaerospora TaxID=78915 RepID=A0A4P9XU70_9FUNG|nr:ankyrin repeat-containing domain protein [Thamnocephalis sphaerospora]|eukprot:RKP09758.1 ankyrin repeat-containing domain protein [Thamnocephalis sphaerospora]